MQFIETLRTKEELKECLFSQGLDSSDKAIENLKKQYQESKINNCNLNLEQLDSVAGGWECLKFIRHLDGKLTAEFNKRYVGVKHSVELLQESSKNVEQVGFHDLSREYVSAMTEMLHHDKSLTHDQIDFLKNTISPEISKMYIRDKNSGEYKCIGCKGTAADYAFREALNNYKVTAKSERTKHFSSTQNHEQKATERPINLRHPTSTRHFEQSAQRRTPQQILRAIDANGHSITKQYVRDHINFETVKQVEKHEPEKTTCLYFIKHDDGTLTAKFLKGHKVSYKQSVKLMTEAEAKAFEASYTNHSSFRKNQDDQYNIKGGLFDLGNFEYLQAMLNLITTDKSLSNEEISHLAGLSTFYESSNYQICDEFTETLNKYQVIEQPSSLNKPNIDEQKTTEKDLKQKEKSLSTMQVLQKCFVAWFKSIFYNDSASNYFKNYTSHQKHETGIEMQDVSNWKEHLNSTSHSQDHILNSTQILQRYFVDWLKSIFYRDSITSNLKKQSHYQEEIEMNSATGWGKINDEAIRV